MLWTDRVQILFIKYLHRLHSNREVKKKSNEEQREEIKKKLHRIAKTTTTTTIKQQRRNGLQEFLIFVQRNHDLFADAITWFGIFMNKIVRLRGGAPQRIHFFPLLFTGFQFTLLYYYYFFFLPWDRVLRLICVIDKTVCF